MFFVSIFRTIIFLLFCKLIYYSQIIWTFQRFSIIRLFHSNDYSIREALTRGASTRIYNFTIYKALRNCVGQSHVVSVQRSGYVPCPGFSPRSRYPHGWTLAATSFKQWPAKRMTKQLYTCFMDSDIVFRIAIVHATNFETAIDTASVMTALKNIACVQLGDTTNQHSKVFKSVTKR